MNRFIAFGLLTTVIAKADIVYDPGVDFHLGENSGVWTYAYAPSLGGEVKPLLHRAPANSLYPYSVTGLETWYFPSGALPVIAHNPGAASWVFLGNTVGAGDLMMHPGPGGETPVLRFTAPWDGNYRISGSFFGQNNNGTTSDAHVTAAATRFFDAQIEGFGAASVRTFDSTRTLHAGEFVDFAVGFGANGNYNADMTGLTATVTLLDRGSDAKSEFSATANPSGPWVYGYRTNLTGPFTTFAIKEPRAGIDYWFDSTVGAEPNVGRNPDRYLRFYVENILEERELTFHPGNKGEYGVVRWTAPATASYKLLAKFKGVGGSSTVDLHISKNGAEIYAADLSYRGQEKQHTSVLALSVGDIVEFSVGYGANHSWDGDTTGLDVTFVKVESVESPILVAAPAIQLTAPTQPGLIYQLQSTPSLNSPLWQNFGTAVGGGSSDIQLFAPATGPTDFYRVLTFK